MARSRGLGDVYKRQPLHKAMTLPVLLVWGSVTSWLIVKVGDINQSSQPDHHNQACDMEDANYNPYNKKIWDVDPQPSQSTAYCYRCAPQP
jgi:hypothetical protein